MNKLLKAIINTVNGIAFRFFDIEGVIFRAEPIKQRQDITILGLPKNQAILVDLIQNLPYNLLVTGVSADLAQDDGKELQLDRRNNYLFSYAQIIVRVVDRITKKPVKTIVYFISSYPRYQNEIILSPDYLYEFLCNQDINSITFTGEPVHRLDSIVFTRGVPSTINQ